MRLKKENENRRKHKDSNESIAKSCSAQNPTRKKLELGKSCRGGGGGVRFKINLSKMLKKNFNLVIVCANQQRTKKGADAAECSTAVYQNCDTAPSRICLQSVINEKQFLVYIIVSVKKCLNVNLTNRLLHLTRFQDIYMDIIILLFQLSNRIQYYKTELKAIKMENG